MTVLPGDRPRRGEVWAFCGQDGRLLAHRCIRPGPQPLFQGDANPRPDAPLPTNLLVGKVVAVEVDGAWRRLGSLDRVRGLFTLGRGHTIRRILRWPPIIRIRSLTLRR